MKIEKSKTEKLKSGFCKSEIAGNQKLKKELVNMHGDIQTHLYMKNKMKKHEIEHITDMIENGSKGGFYYGMTWSLKTQGERDIEDIAEQIKNGDVSGYNWQFRIKKYEKKKEKMKNENSKNS